MSETRTSIKQIRISANPDDVRDIDAKYWNGHAFSEFSSKQNKLVSGDNIKTINGENILIPNDDKSITNIDTNLKKITYNELLNLKNVKKLSPGQQYRITDYVTTTTQENTQSAGHKFDIIVTADSIDTINEIARVCLSDNDNDTYFANSGANLDAWQIWYCIENNTERFAWADETNGKGVIYRMIDEWNNDCPYDFKNIKFKRNVRKDNKGIVKDGGNDSVEKYCYTFSFIYDSNIIEDVSIKGNQIPNAIDYKIKGVYNNIIKTYIFGEVGSNIAQQHLNNIVFFNHFIGYGENFYYLNGCNCNTFGNNCYNNTFNYSCFSNIFGNECYDNFFYDKCVKNTFGNNCYNNTINDDCNNNTFGNNCYDNTLGSGCYKNTFGNNCYENELILQCYNNIFAVNCNNNTLGKWSYSNNFGIDCNNNNLSESCKKNTFGTSSAYNILGKSCNQNTFGNSNAYNILGDSCINNSFGNNCYNNTLGISCDDNSFGNECAYNSFRQNDYTTTVSDVNKRYIASGNIMGYVKNVHYGDGCKDIVLHNQSNNIKNINISQGLRSTEKDDNDYIHPTFVEIGNNNQEYETTVARNSSGEIKVFCMADFLV